MNTPFRKHGRRGDRRKELRYGEKSCTVLSSGHNMAAAAVHSRIHSRLDYLYKTYPRWSLSISILAYQGRAHEATSEEIIGN